MASGHGAVVQKGTCSEIRLQWQFPMLTLYSYPTLFGVADNNGYGLKVFAFLKLTGVSFRHEHIFDIKNGTEQTPQNCVSERGQIAVRWP